jgi:hypothetical protein
MLTHKTLRLLFLTAAITPCSYAATLDKTLGVEGQTHEAARQSQQKVDALDSETQALLHEYQQLMQQGDYQQGLNQELELRVQEQALEIEKLQQQIADVQITRLHMMPLLREMVAALKQFIELDLPFEKAARLQSITQLEQLLASATVPIAEKFRRVMEAWQAESDYSYELYSYRDVVQLEGEELSVDYLRIGRNAWYFLSLDGKRSGYWHAQKKQWLILDTQFNASVREGLRLAQRQLAPRLLALPVAAAEVK